MKRKHLYSGIIFELNVCKSFGNKNFGKIHVSPVSMLSHLIQRTALHTCINCCWSQARQEKVSWFYTKRTPVSYKTSADLPLKAFQRDPTTYVIVPESLAYFQFFQR